jgi:hypothetical protein
VPPGAHERLVQPLKVLGNGQSVHHDEPLNGGRVVHGRTEGHQRAPVVARDREPIAAQVPHQGGNVARHGALGRLRVPGSVRRQRRLAVTAQVRSNHKERFGKLGRYPVPGRVRAEYALRQAYCRL